MPEEMVWLPVAEPPAGYPVSVSSVLVADPGHGLDIAGRVRQRASIVVEPITNGRTDRFSSSDLKVIRDRKIDVILRFGFRILRGDVG